MTKQCKGDMQGKGMVLQIDWEVRNEIKLLCCNIFLLLQMGTAHWQSFPRGRETLNYLIKPMAPAPAGVLIRYLEEESNTTCAFSWIPAASDKCSVRREAVKLQGCRKMKLQLLSFLIKSSSEGTVAFNPYFWNTTALSHSVAKE